MRLKTPPAVQLFISSLLMWIISIYADNFRFIFKFNNELALFCLIIGGTIIVFGIVAFRKAETTFTPQHPDKASSLVTLGIYQYTRNPMYLGLSSILLASCFYFSSLLGIIVYVPFFILYITVFQIIPEEEVMKSLFNDEYLDYCSKVRRWI